MINPNVGAIISACGNWIDGSILDRIAKEKATVLLVLDWDWAMT